MSYWTRQLATVFCLGDVEAEEAQREMWKLQDVPWRVKLVLAVGKSSGGKCLLAASDSITLQLPDTYDSTRRLFALLAANGTLKVAMTPVGGSASYVLLRGNDQDQGVMSFDDTITSIVVSNPSASAVFLEYSLMEIPDLDDPASYREGDIVRGVV